MASLLAYFLTDRPPDDALLAAAADGSLGAAAGVASQVERLLASDVGRANLEGAAYDYFHQERIEQVIIDSTLEPTWGDALRDAMRNEAHAFLQRQLWNAPLPELLTSRATRVNEPLAALYEVVFSDAALDANGFAEVELPATRSGLLTQAGWLAGLARPNTVSVVMRGLRVRNDLLCLPSPLPPQVPEAVPVPADATEREKAANRAADPLCADCHGLIDPYGLALDGLDIIGRFRAADPLGGPIDTAVTLPPELGGILVADAAELGTALAASPDFARCITQRMLDYAMTEGASGATCIPDQVVRVAELPDATFGEIVREIAISRSLGVRAGGG
jgi:hypothetical protein